MTTIKAVFWDFGGVMTTSPFEAFARYEQANNLPNGFIRTVNATNPDHNAWAQLERNEISVAEFDQLFATEAKAQGHAVRGQDILQLLGGELRPEMVEALRRCKNKFRTACLTNNFPAADAVQSTVSNFEQVKHLFEQVFESRLLGVRKPQPQFYQTACERMQIAPDQVVFLDDLGINLKPARALGMTTIKVGDPITALRELESVLNIPLLAD